MKKHNYRLLEDVIRAMLDDQEFWYLGEKIYFRPNTGFMQDDSDSTSFCTNYLESWKDWQIKPHWTDNLNAKTPVLCWVDDIPIDPTKSPYVKYIEATDISNDYIDIRGEKWKYATPVKPEECWKEETQ